MNICRTFTGTAGINNHYSSRFLLGQLLLLHEALGTNFEKHIFIYDEDENIPVEIRSKSRNRDVAQRGAAKLADKKLAGLTELDQSHAVVTVVFIPKDAKESVYIINIVEADGREILNKGVPLSNLSREIGKREIVEVNLNFNVKERKLKFKDHFDIEFTKPVSLEVYNEQDKFKGGFHPIPYSNKLKEAFDEAIESQRVPTQGQSSVSEKQAQSVLKGYGNLFNEIGNAVFHFISIITGELQSQAVLHGAFSHYSDIRQKSGEGQMLVVVQFQSGSQGIIDIAVACIGSGNSGAERFYPVLFELKMRETGSEVSAQIESRIARGAACKMLTDEILAFIMGIVFNNKARSPDGVYTVTKPKILNVPHSSVLINPFKKKGNYKSHPKKLIFGKRGIPYWIFVEVDVPYWVFIERNQAEGLGLRDSCIILESDQDIKQYLERSTTGSKTLDLFNTCLNNSLIETLVEFLSTQEVDVLDLSFNELESEGVKKLIDALVNSKRTVSFLNLSDNTIGSNGSESGAISSLARLIENNNVVHLAISDVAMTPNDFSKIFYALKNNTSIEKLDLSQNKIEGGFNEEIVGVMVDILYRHPTLTVLDLSNTGITDNTIKSIVEKAEKDCAEEMQPNIKNLYIREGEITEEGMESLVKFVTQAKKLESLSLSANPIGTGVDKLIDMLKDTNISTLELCNISLRCDKSNTKNIAKMMADLIDRSKVKILDLSYNDLNAETIEKIFSTISSRKEKMLEKLNLSGNEIEEKEQAGLPSAISKSLTNNNVLESLGLADMSIHDNVLGEVVFELEGSNIRDLDISGNDIGGATIEALSNYLIRKDTVLEYLNIADYTDEDKTRPLYENVKDLFKVLEENETLTHLDISSYVLDSDFINAISEYLSNEKANLLYLDLSKSELTDPLTQMKTLFSALEKNDKLQHLYLLDIEMTDEIADVIIAHRKENRKSKIFTSEGQLSNGKKKELRDLSVEVISSLPDVKKGVKNTQEGKFDEDKVSRKMDELGKSLSGSRQFMDHGKRPNTTVDVSQAEALDEKKRKFL
ncbi:hypothetical protein [Wolbachia endosymbiont (group A) of Agelastica alni]|uniref:hypothetical protein n=1 Tax=Wolbachia endosymbiont (group A) of Agelastica alni TaxID=3066130 RepID=UPI00313339F1